MEELIHAIHNAVLRRFGRKLIHVTPFAHQPHLLGLGEWRVGRLAWPDQMDQLEYFHRRNGITEPEQRAITSG